MSFDSDLERILSVQSHVASGHVGQQAAVFPLQLLGYEVDVVNTVNYSNHAGYGRLGGYKSTAEGLSSIFDVMEKNGLLHQSRVVTGYIPNAECLSVVSQVIRRMRDRDKAVIYLLDPVMGDAGRLYVSPDVVPLYRELLPCATIITPNYFEVEVLTGIAIKSISSLQSALRALHLKYHVPHVVISSLPLDNPFEGVLPDQLTPDSRNFPEFVTSNAKLLCIASSQIATEHAAPSKVYALAIPNIPGYFSGVGDFFSAMVLGHFDPSGHASGSSLSYAVSRACRTTFALLVRTHIHAASLPPEDRTRSDEELDAKDGDRKIRRMKGRELRIIQERRLILEHEDKYHMGNLVEWKEFWT